MKNKRSSCKLVCDGGKFSIVCECAVSLLQHLHTFAGETFQRARRLKEKMLTNLVMAKDRLEVLGILLCFAAVRSSKDRLGVLGIL